MAAYTLMKIAASYGRHYSTASRHIKSLIEKKKFKKKSPGKMFSENELKQLEKLMDFKYRPQE